MSLKGPVKLIFIFYACNLRGKKFVFLDIANNHCSGSQRLKCDIAIAILNVCQKIARSICCDHRVLTRIAAVEHLDTLGIPVLHESMMTIQLHLISFTVVVLLTHNSGVVNIYGVPNPNTLDKDRGWVRLL